MKNLLFKDFRLVVTWPVYLIICVAGLFFLVSGLPASFALWLSYPVYPLLFLGANKGTQTNDVFFSLLLPVKRKKIVLSRLFTLGLLHLFTIVLLFLLLPGNVVATMVRDRVSTEGPSPAFLGPKWFLGQLGIGLLTLGILDLIFVTWFYRDARNFALPYGIAAVVSFLCMIFFSMILPAVLAATCSEDLFSTGDPLTQCLLLLGGIVSYFLLHLLTYHLAARNFEKVDF